MNRKTIVVAETIGVVFKRSQMKPALFGENQIGATYISYRYFFFWVL